MRLAALDVPAAADTVLYTVPAQTRAVATLILCNRGAALAKVRVAHTAGGAPAASDWIEYDAVLPVAGAIGGSSAQLTGLALSAGEKIYVRTDVATVSAVLNGLSETVV